MLLSEARPVELKKFQRVLLKWFDANQRDLPWRKRRTLYRIWVSEIMLQQTQVATVIAYYKRFMKQFPSVAKLAAAGESEVLKLWEGLGYYRRARQLHSAAKQIVAQHGGRFPKTFDEVLALPGIGRYTAGAVLSIALDQPQPILEGNTIRLFARLLAMREDPKTSASQKTLWAFSESLLPAERAGDFNQALMELGSEVCTPKSPACPSCPIVNFCPTFAGALQETIPASSKKMIYEAINEAVLLVSRKVGSTQKYLVRMCQEGERWSGLWDFPRFAVQGDHPADALQQELKRFSGIEAPVEATDIRLKHAVTKYRITLDVYRCEVNSARLRKNGVEMRWVSAAEIETLPMSITGRKIARKTCN